jgi:hypothetical protein
MRNLVWAPDPAFEQLHLKFWQLPVDMRRSHVINCLHGHEVGKSRRLRGIESGTHLENNR